MKNLIPALAIGCAILAGCADNPTTTDNLNNDSNQYVVPQTGSAGMTIPDSDKSNLPPTSDPDLLQTVDSNMQNGAPPAQQGY